MSSEKELGFAIIGCGMMGQRHAQILRATPGCKVVCVQDKFPEAAKKIAGDAVACESYEDALNVPGVDAVVLCLPSGLHAEFGIKAARAGKHVVTEKPIDIVVAEGEKLAEECRKNKVVCAVISQNRFAEGAAALKAALDRGDLGSPVLTRASVKWFRNDEYYSKSDWRGRFTGEGGGVLMNQAIHTMDLLLWFFGEPVEIHGMTHSSREVLETEDVGIAIMRFKNGMLATLEASTSTYPGFEEKIEVHSTTASATLEKGKLSYWKHAEDKPIPEPPSFEPATPGLDAKFELFQRQYRNILNAVHGKEQLVVTPGDAIGVVRSTLAIYESQQKR